ncbi:MAG: Crp/Fnr family transcriptional regulator [Bacilli bacterium]|jgi:CRP-like cAMP-binding protein|nr:Crp/Fnr family transcriptional regulator [Bacilli bacterium]MCX4254399.1 Crp/Fnr family transcriptional regulator [Bacilli bacterium]
MTYLFDNINSKNKEKLLLMLEANTLHFKKDSTILSVIKNDNIVGIITSGYLQIIRTDHNGIRTIIEELEEQDVFGSFISSLKNKEYEIIAKEDTEIIIIDYDNIINCNLTNKSFYNQFIKNLLQITSKKIQEKNERIEILTKKTIRNKLLEYFKIISKKHNSKYIYLPFNFTDLADYLAIDRSAMSRELKYLKEEGFIEIKGKRIKLLY